MKLFYFFALLAVLATTALAWEKEDHEIFDLVSDVEASEGKGTTFYSWLDVPSTATTSEIAKAYRKLSMQLHPDKNPNVKGVQERFARLGVVSAILRNKESRKRYDFFYKNGVPKWRGTGYYYSRFRPGVGFVMTFLIFVTSAVQYVIQKMNYKKDLERIEKITAAARTAAWGTKLVPGAGQRKVRINLGSSRDDDGYSETKWLDMVVEGQDVFILEPNGDMHLIDSSTAVQPTIGNTWFCVLVKSLFRKALGSKSKDTLENVDGTIEDSDDASSTTGSEATGTGTDSSKAARVPTVKAGGKRRKAVKRR
ncbi:DnaJ domain-containing protein [Crucibulum laeve]|uniref:DnaJ domain-containing protein n=1 Tax=Crucibulum laeve TaxID=68775 RepID=A0A5C3MDZ1_9AGAR|nr:DnaJ domain-containing protein [Crucibulum laeve]